MNIKNVLLLSIETKIKKFPRGLVELASYLESRDYFPTILLFSMAMHDLQKTEDINDKLKEVIEEAINKIDPKIVGVSVRFTIHYPRCLEAFKICKDINRKIITVAGGPHVTFTDLESIKSPYIDIIVRGEGEWTMLDLLQAIETKKDLCDVRGITFKKGTKIIRNPDRPLGVLNELPPINYGLLPDEYVKKTAIYGMLNRGCNFNCSFCAEKAFWKKRRPFAAKRLIDEMKHLQPYGNQIYALEDSMVHLGSIQFQEFCSEVGINKLRFFPGSYIQSRVDTITQKGLIALKTIGITDIYLGIENGSPEVLKAMNKGFTHEQIIKSCQALRKHGFRVNTFWIIGHPGDNLQEAERSFNFLEYLLERDLIQNIELALFVPYPGTSFFHHPENHDINILSYKWEDWHGWSNKSICQLKYFSAKELTAVYDKHKVLLRRHKSMHKT